MCATDQLQPVRVKAQAPDSLPVSDLGHLFLLAVVENNDVSVFECASNYRGRGMTDHLEHRRA